MSDWISVDDRLPERMKGRNQSRCLVSVNGCFGARIDIFVFAASGGSWNEFQGYVTHWMSLPEPPDEN